MSATNPSWYGYPPNFNSGTGVTFSNNTIDFDFKSTQEFRELLSRLDTIEEMLCILKPDLEMMEKYQSLKEAYEAYHIILKLVKEKKDESQ